MAGATVLQIIFIKKYLHKFYNLFKDPNFEADAFDGMPLVFSEKLNQTPKAKDFKITLNNGQIVSPECVTLAPANEENESNTRMYY